MRGLVWRLLWGIAFFVCVPRFRVDGTVPKGPVVFAANHQSHADTAALQLALVRSGQSQVWTAGAEDYWFATWWRRLVAWAIGVYPFPRRGLIGVEHSIDHLNAGSSVVIYPQGSRDGGRFRPGVGHIARDGTPVVPVTISGTELLLPKGSVLPRRHDVTIRFGAPLFRAHGESAVAFAGRLETEVREQASIGPQGELRRMPA